MFFFQEAINVISAVQSIFSFDNILSSLGASGILFIYCTSFEFFCKADREQRERCVMEKEIECMCRKW